MSNEKGGSKLRANILTRIQAHANAFLILDETNDCPYFLESRAQYVTCASLPIEDQSPGKGVCAHTCHILDDDNHAVRLFVCPVDTLGYVRERFRRGCLANRGTWAGRRRSAIKQAGDDHNSLKVEQRQPELLAPLQLVNKALVGLFALVAKDSQIAAGGRVIACTYASGFPRLTR